MKKPELLLYTLYVAGIVVKFLKLPMHTVFILITLLALVAYYIASIFIKSKTLTEGLAGLVTVVWLFGLLAVLKHFPFQAVVLIAAGALTAALILNVFKKNLYRSANSVLCAAVMIITAGAALLPAHRMYYVTNIRFNHEIETDYYSWSKYSWFFYKEGKFEEAARANAHAEVAVKKSLNTRSTAMSKST